ncbi:MAG TPA: DUF2905 domain-containing protein [Cytophagaceae bacterium]|nr:DUF2905 domain-containing protein [Cytophagaceae bacterium]
MEDWSGLGKTLLIMGGVMVAAGLLILIFGKIPFIGKLPGDFSMKGKNWSFYFPLASSVLISIILSLIFYLIQKVK